MPEIVYESTARCAIIRANCVLVSQAVGEPFCILPGGHIEPGETPWQAMQRELREEVASDVTDISGVAVLQNTWQRGGRIDGDTVHETMHLFRGTLTAPVEFEGIMRRGEAHLRFFWVPLADVARAFLMPLAVYPYLYAMGGRAYG